MPTTSIFTSVATREPLDVEPTSRLVIAYARTNHGGAEEISRQREAAEAYAQKAYGRPLDAFFEDTNGRHGLLMNGPGVNEMLDLSETGAVGVIVVGSIDRVSRSSAMVRNFVGRCRKLNIEIHVPSVGKLCLDLINPSDERLAALKPVKRSKCRGLDPRSCPAGIDQPAAAPTAGTAARDM